MTKRINTTALLLATITVVAGTFLSFLPIISGPFEVYTSSGLLNREADGTITFAKTVSLSSAVLDLAVWIVAWYIVLAVIRSVVQLIRGEFNLSKISLVDNLGFKAITVMLSLLVSIVSFFYVASGGDITSRGFPIPYITSGISSTWNINLPIFLLNVLVWWIIVYFVVSAVIEVFSRKDEVKS